VIGTPCHLAIPRVQVPFLIKGRGMVVEPRATVYPRYQAEEVGGSGGMDFKTGGRWERLLILIRTNPNLSSIKRFGIWGTLTGMI
jgi:hypothetical protein